MEELIELANEGYIVEIMLDDAGDYLLAITKKGIPTTTSYRLEKTNYDNATDKSEVVDEYFEKAKTELNKALVDENMMIDRMD